MVESQLRTILPILTGGFIILIGVVFLISLVIPKLETAMLDKFAPSKFPTERLRRLAYRRAISLSFMYILLGSSFVSLSIPAFLIAWVLIALGMICLVCVFIFQSKLQ